MIDDYYSVITQPTADPVTLTETKEWLRVSNTVDDALISALISTATTQGEAYTNRQFMARTIEGFFAGVDTSRFLAYPFIQIRRAPVSITSVEMVVNGVLTAVTDYEVQQTGGFPRLVFQNDLTGYDTDIPYPIKVTFEAGSASVAEDIKTAIKQHVLFLYENRGDVRAEGGIAMPIETKLIYSKHRIVNTFG